MSTPSSTQETPLMTTPISTPETPLVTTPISTVRSTEPEVATTLTPEPVLESEVVADPVTLPPKVPDDAMASIDPLLELVDEFMIATCVLAAVLITVLGVNLCYCLWRCYKRRQSRLLMASFNYNSGAPSPTATNGLQTLGSTATQFLLPNAAAVEMGSLERPQPGPRRVPLAQQDRLLARRQNEAEVEAQIQEVVEDLEVNNDRYATCRDY